MPGPQELVFAPLGGVGEIGMNLSIYGIGDERRRTWLAVDLGVSFASEEHLPGVDLILPDSQVPGRRAKEYLGVGAHACARRPLRRTDRPVAAAENSDLCHALHGGLARGEMRRRARLAENSRDRCCSGQPFRCWPVQRRAGDHGAFHSGIERADHPHSRRHRAAYRRLEDRSDTHPARSDRREEASRAGRGGVPGPGRRFNQCRA